MTRTSCTDWNHWRHHFPVGVKQAVMLTKHVFISSAVRLVRDMIDEASRRPFRTEEDDTALKDESRTQCSESVLHQTDLILRKLVSSEIKKKKGEHHQNKRASGQLNKGNLKCCCQFSSAHQVRQTGCSKWECCTSRKQSRLKIQLGVLLSDEGVNKKELSAMGAAFSAKKSDIYNHLQSGTLLVPKTFNDNSADASKDASSELYQFVEQLFLWQTVNWCHPCVTRWDVKREKESVNFSGPTRVNSAPWPRPKSFGGIGRNLTFVSSCDQKALLNKNAWCAHPCSGRPLVCRTAITDNGSCVKVPLPAKKETSSSLAQQFGTFILHFKKKKKKNQDGDTFLVFCFVRSLESTRYNSAMCAAHSAMTRLTILTCLFLSIYRATCINTYNHACWQKQNKPTFFVRCNTWPRKVSEKRKRGYSFPGPTLFLLKS